MSRLILVRGARQLLTLHGPPGPRRGADLRNLGIIQDGAVLIRDGLIREVGPTRRLENLAEARHADEINAAGRVVMPGFVDSHTHLVSGPARLGDFEMRLAGASHAEIIRAGGGSTAIFNLMQDVPSKSLEAQAWRILQQTIRQGTTTLEAKSGYGVNETGEVKILRAQAGLNSRLDHLVSTFLCPRFLPPGHPVTPEQHANWICDHMLPLVRRRKLAEIADAFYEEGAFTIEQTRRMLDAAKANGFAIKLHAGQYSNIGGVAAGLELGALSLDHLIHVSSEEIGALARSSVIATLLPGPVFYVAGERYAPARALIDRGVAVALATDYNPESCPTHNMQMVLSLACRKMNMTPAEAISAATINGAYALNRGDQAGSLEFGKQADLLILSVPDYRELPYHFGVNLVDTTMMRGNIVYQASKVMCQSDFAGAERR